jgi:hypothetical protein
VKALFFCRISHNESSVLGHEAFKNGFIGFAEGWTAKNLPDYRLPESSYF